jgi:hypothetical protein
LIEGAGSKHQLISDFAIGRENQKCFRIFWSDASNCVEFVVDVFLLEAILNLTCGLLSPWKNFFF